MHGYSGNARDFDDLARALSVDTRVVCPDVAGRGRSDWLGSPFEYHFGQFVADLNALLLRVGAKQVDWIGTSMGGLLGMIVAGQAGSPIRRLVMNDVGAFLPAEALQAIGRNLHSPARFASLEEVENHMRRTHREWDELTDEQYRRLAVHGSRRADDGHRLHYDPQITRLMRSAPFSPGLFFWDAWYKVRCPVLLLRGERSQVFPRSVAHLMLDVKPKTQLVEIPGCGHVPALMSPGQIAVVSDFLHAPSAHDFAATAPHNRRGAELEASQA